MKTRLTFTFLMMLSALVMMAQVKTPAASPSSTLKQTVGLTDITIDYSRPSKKDRTIFGDLVPYGEMWRTGANGATIVTFSTDVDFGEVTVPSGSYALLTIPTEGDWTVILYNRTDFGGVPREYDEGLEVARISVPSHKLNQTVETFTIDVNNLRDESADFVISWDNTSVIVPLFVNTESMVEASISSTMSGPSAGDYYSAGRYYFDHDKDIRMAHAWVSKAAEKQKSAFWILKTKSEIEAKMGDYKQAIATAKESIQAATEAGNDQYVKYNNENIAKWSKM